MMNPHICPDGRPCQRKKIPRTRVFYNTIKDYISRNYFNNFDALMHPTRKPDHLTGWYFESPPSFSAQHILPIAPAVKCSVFRSGNSISCWSVQHSAGSPCTQSDPPHCSSTYSRIKTTEPEGYSLCVLTREPGAEMSE